MTKLAYTFDPDAGRDAGRDVGGQNADDARSDAPASDDAGAEVLFRMTFENGLVNATSGANDAPGMILAAQPILGEGSAETTGAGTVAVRRFRPASDLYITLYARLADGGAGLAELTGGGATILGVSVAATDGRVAIYGGSAAFTEAGVIAPGTTYRFGVQVATDDAGSGRMYRVYVAADGAVFGAPLLEGTIGTVAPADTIAVGSIASDLRVVVDEVEARTDRFAAPR